MKIILLLLLSFYFNGSFSQKKTLIKINDSTYWRLIEDTSTIWNNFNEHKTYKMGVTFTGFYSGDPVKIIENNKMLFCDTVTTWNYKDTNLTDLDSYKEKQAFCIIVKRKTKHDLKFIFKGYEMTMPFRYGYRAVYIGIDPDRIEGKPVLVYNFYYTNAIFYSL